MDRYFLAQKYDYIFPYDYVFQLSLKKYISLHISLNMKVTWGHERWLCETVLKKYYTGTQGSLYMHTHSDTVSTDSKHAQVSVSQPL